jgi:hypothetical protein
VVPQIDASQAILLSTPVRPVAPADLGPHDSDNAGRDGEKKKEIKPLEVVRTCHDKNDLIV